MAKATALYDVLNDIIIDVTLKHYSIHEIEQAEELIDSNNFSDELSPIFLFDRGYPSQEFIKKLNDRKLKFAMRCHSRFITSVRKCSQGNHVVEY